MKKQKVIEVFRKSHTMFRELLIALTVKQLTETKVLEDWTVK